jgi:hypothetical protein
VRPRERSEAALLRELIEEVGWGACILGTMGRATQFVSAEGEGYFAIRATYFRAALIERRTTQCEHEIVWLPAAACLATAAGFNPARIAVRRRTEGIACPMVKVPLPSLP